AIAMTPKTQPTPNTTGTTNAPMPASNPCVNRNPMSAAIVNSATVPTDVRTELGPGAEVTTRSLPIERVGLYVPGGRAVY
ncbi:histidinol dehydrogenase, partial [Mycobacterium tuberculosis]|nr:histidinol dehydrogenase [Mycobacterium tuberculosis]